MARPQAHRSSLAAAVRRGPTPKRATTGQSEAASALLQQLAAPNSPGPGRTYNSPEVPPFDPELPYAFLITRFEESDESLAIRTLGVDPAAKKYGFPVYRIDEIPFSSAVIEGTRESIAGADFVIADLTGSRPSCYYEVGYAHALGRPVILMIKDTEEPAFDVAGLHFLRYRDAHHLRTLLGTYLGTHVLSTHGGRDRDDENKGKFGRTAFVDPFIVTGRVRATSADGRSPNTLSFKVDVMVRSVDPSQPLKGDVTFHLHEEFAKRKHKVRSKNGIARLKKIQTYGTFTLGAVLHDSGVRLELDLSRLPGAGAEFRSR